MNTKQASLRNLRDADLRVTFALPAAASTTVTSTPIDTGVRDSFSSFTNGAELVCQIPPVNATILPDTKTQTVTIENSDDPAFGKFDTLGTKVLTGADGVGAGADELRVGLSGALKRYVRAKIVSSASTTDGSSVVAELCLVT